MSPVNTSPNRTDTVLRWVARIWSLPAILFVLGQIFVPEAVEAPVLFIDWLALGLQITAVFGLAIAWRWELIGSSLSLLSMVASFVVFAITRSPAMLLQFGWIWVVAVIIPACLFLAYGLRTRPTSMRPA